MAIEIYKYDAYKYGRTQTPLLLYSSETKTKYNIVPGVLKKEINKAEAFEFDIYPSRYNDYENSSTDEVIGYDIALTLNVGMTYISIQDTEYNGDDNRGILFYGRIVKIEYDLDGKRHVVCEGLIANLYDYPMYMPTDSNPGKTDMTTEEFNKLAGIHDVYTKYTRYLFQYAITAYAEGTGSESISIGTVSPNNDYTKEKTDDDDESWYRYNYTWDQSVLDFIQSKLLNVYGGVLKMRYVKDAYGISGRIDWADDPIVNTTLFKAHPQSITYGDNVLDASIEDISSDVPTGIFGIGTSKNGGISFGVTRISNGHYKPYVIYGNNYIDDGINTVKAVTFENAFNDSQRNRYTNRYVNIYCSNRKFKVNVNCIDKHFITVDEDDEMTYDLIDIGYLYHVNIPFPDFPIDDDLTCLSCEIDINNMKNNSYVFGDYVPPELLKSRYISG